MSTFNLQRFCFVFFPLWLHICLTSSDRVNAIKDPPSKHKSHVTDDLIPQALAVLSRTGAEMLIYDTCVLVCLMTSQLQEKQS